jgi:hypothetical protein
MKQTAVDWFKDVIESFGNKHELQMSWDTFDELFEQAKEIEKDQKETYKYTEFDIISAFEYGWNQRHYGIMDEGELHGIQKRFIQSINELKQQEQ